MAIRAEITCISKTSRCNPHERIHSVGGINPNGARWRISQEQAVTGIDTGSYSFYITNAGCAVEVIVAVGESGNRYLKTVADNEQPDNLLRLSECH